MDQAACIVFLVDSQAGVRPYDEQIAKYLQTCK
eukprot:COSAG01_NODE_75868_length_191_cov_27.301075_1_plen_32_part_10